MSSGQNEVVEAMGDGTGAAMIDGKCKTMRHTSNARWSLT